MLNLLRGIATSLLLAINSLYGCTLVYLLVIVKLLMPTKAGKDWCSRQMVKVAENWIGFNSASLKALTPVEWRAEGMENLRHDRSYLVCANHISGTDIVALQAVFNRRIPFMRFFMKQELRYVPLLGLAWQALDFPMMKRHSAEYLAKHPEKRGEDLETTKKTCAKLRGKPITVINFLEGTRITPAKHARQNSPFKNLLKPKVGGLAFMLEAMGDQFDSLLDVTIYYPRGMVSVWGMMCGRLSEAVVKVREIKIPAAFCKGGYLENSTHREQVQNWVQEIWQRKDQLLSEMSRDAKLSTN